MDHQYYHSKIVIGVPAHNEEPFIEEMLESIQKQNLTDFLVLISDNASTDQTARLCLKYCEKDERFKYIRQEKNIGAAHNVQFLLDVSDSPYVALVGAHDLLEPEFLDRHINFLASNSQFSLSYSNIRWVDEAGTFTRLSDGGRFIFPDRSGFYRYIKSVERAGECTAVNSVIRREALGKFRFQLVFGLDLVMLSHLLYWGPFYRHESPLYKRREFVSRSSSGMERIMGKKGAHPKLTKTWGAYIKDFLSLEGAMPVKIALLPTLLLALEMRLSIGPIRLVRVVVRYMRRWEVF